MNCLRIIILLFMQAFTQSSFSQISNLKFSHLTTSDGLSQSSVFAILKDYKGFMWFATDEGLNKYDGYKFTVYKHDPENKESISNNAINGLLEDGNHNLWITSAGGLDKFDRIKEAFIHYNSGSKSIVFKSIFQDSKKKIWIGSNEGFCLFDADKGKFKFYKNNEKDSNSLSQNFVYKITEDDFGELWIATRNGLNRFNPATEKFIRYHNDPANNKSIGSGYIKTVYKDSKGNIWVGTQGSGVALFNRSDNSFINFKHDLLNKSSISHNDILCFTEDKKGQLWIGTENGGINLFDDSKNTFVCYINNDNDPFSISANSIHSLYKDDIGNIWAGTWSGGINFLPFFGDKFTHYKKISNSNNSLNNNLVLSITGDAANNIWIGTDGGGLNRFDPRTHNFTEYKYDNGTKKGIFNNYVLSVAEYAPGILALGFHRGGIDLFDVKNNRFTHYAPQDLNSNRITSLTVNLVYKDRQQNLWVGTNDNGGLFLFDKKAGSFTNFFHDINNNKSIGGSLVFAMFETKAGQFWIGGDNGLDLFNRSTKEFTHYSYDPENKQSLANNMVYAIAEDSLGNLWLGTAGGLIFFDTKTKTFTTYTENDGLPNNAILTIQQDHHGNLWLSTNKGLSKFNPAKKSFTNFTTGDGLQSNTFKPKASFQTTDGEMFFGGINGFNTFYPDSIKNNDFVPPVYITGFQVFNKPVAPGSNSPLKQAVNEVKEITLSYRQSVFTIEFAALNFTHPEQNKYAYKLEGFDEEWNFAGNKRTATYTNLDAGTYFFKVKGSNNDGVWNETGATVKIIITPPFWLTWWFMLLVFLLVAGSCFGFYSFRMNIIQKQKLLLEEKVNQQTVELVHLNAGERKARLEAEQAQAESDIARQDAYHANEELLAKNKELEQFAYVASHDLQEPLRTTAGFVELLQKQYRGRLDEKADKYLHYMSDASGRMKVLIKDLLDFSRLGTKGAMEKVNCNAVLKNVLLDIAAAISEAGAVIDYDELPLINGYPTEIKLVFQNLIINAIKFRRKEVIPLIKIAAQKREGCWEFSLSDNGIGIEKKYKERIFEIFQRLHLRSEYEGSGIGLAHCKKIIELHHGKIWMESSPGEGTIFYFTIPEKNI